jgi:predicted RNA polymerase sigma factor
VIGYSGWIYYRGTGQQLDQATLAHPAAPVLREAWLWTVARRRAIDVLRRDHRLAERTGALALPVHQADDDDRLMLIFTCCHPALSIESQVALTLRTVCGLSTAEIASAFLVSETAIIQRLSHARRKISTARIPYGVPAEDDLTQRLSGVFYHATRAELLRQLGRPAQARLADERALGLTANPAERALLEQRLA